MRRDTVYNPNENATVLIIGQAIKAGCSSGLWSGASSWVGARNEEFTDTSYFAARQVGCLEDNSGFLYNVIKVAPSRFYLGVFQAYGILGRCMTLYKERENKLVSYEFDEMVLPKITARKGEVIYVGDIIFEAPCDPKVVGVLRNDRAAQAALANYPNFKADIVYRPLTINNREVDAPKVD